MKIPCPYCGKTFPNIDTLNAHIAICPQRPGAAPMPTAPVPLDPSAYAPAPSTFDADEWLYEQGGGLPPATPPTPPTEAERGFWPWETPPGEGFLMPWEETPQPVATGMPEGWWASPFDVPPEVSAVYDIVYDPDMMAWRVGGTKAGEAAGVQTVRWETISEGGWDYIIGYDADGNVTAREALGRTETAEMDEYEKERLALEKEQLAAQIEAAQRDREQQMRLQQMPYEGMTAYQQQSLALQQQYQQWQQEEARRKHEAQLAAQPRSWLEYAAYTGEQPAIQPWMQPLMPQQYSQLGAGAAIPGYEAESMAGMPELTRPSRQLQARMGPTAMEQLYGYRQARTGVRPEEQQWRQWSAAPPGGQYRGLSYSR